MRSGTRRQALHRGGGDTPGVQQSDGRRPRQPGETATPAQRPKDDLIEKFGTCFVGIIRHPAGRRRLRADRSTSHLTGKLTHGKQKRAIPLLATITTQVALRSKFIPT